MQTLGDPPTPNTLWFSSEPRLISCGSVVGPKEGAGPLGDHFDHVCSDERLGERSWEQAERRLLMAAIDHCLVRAKLKPEDVQVLLAGDLMDQIVTSGYAARHHNAPFFGLYGACSTFSEALLLGSVLVDGGYRKTALCATASHHNAAERQFRAPTEFGAQRPPLSQWTVTGAGACLLGAEPVVKDEPCIVVESGTIGRVVDYDVADPYDLGSAMAPAAADTVLAHLRDVQRSPEYYDLILTGDLGRVGRDLALELAGGQGVQVDGERWQDGGVLIYDRSQNVRAGGSGCACSACVFCGYVWRLMRSRNLRRVLVVATGALLSPLISKQGESIPAVAHAVSFKLV